MLLDYLALLKKQSKDCADIIDRILAKEKYLSNSLILQNSIRELVFSFHKNTPVNKFKQAKSDYNRVYLTDREIEILANMAIHGQNRLIASNMHISVRTVEEYISNIKIKLGIYHKKGLIEFAIYNNL